MIFAAHSVPLRRGNLRNTSPRYGFGDAKFVPYHWRVESDNGAPVFGWYTHHPALYFVLSAIALRLFGMHEWALRLLPLLFSILSLIAGYRFVALTWGKREALVATLFLSVLPMAAYYGVQPWVESAIVWLYFLLLHQYVLWVRQGSRRHLAFAALVLFGGGLLDWPMFFILPGLLLHAAYVAYQTRRRSWWQPALLLSIAALAAIGVHAVHMHFIMPKRAILDEAIATLRDVTPLPISWSLFLRLQLNYFLKYYTVPVSLLVAFAFAWQCVQALRHALSREDYLLLSLVLPPLLYVGLFPKRSATHDFFQYYGLPYVAIGLSITLWTALDRVRRWRPAWRPLALGLLLVGALVLGSIAQTVQLWRQSRTTAVYDTAASPRLKAVLNDPNDIILANGGYTMFLSFYAQSPIIQGAISVERLEPLHRQIVTTFPAGRKVYFLFDPSPLSQITLPAVAVETAALQAYLRRHFTVEQNSIFELYDMTAWSVDK